MTCKVVDEMTNSYETFLKGGLSHQQLTIWFWSWSGSWSGSTIF